jgi:hypothetical protein
VSAGGFEEVSTWLTVAIAFGCFLVMGFVADFLFLTGSIPGAASSIVYVALGLSVENDNDGRADLAFAEVGFRQGAIRESMGPRRFTYILLLITTPPVWTSRGRWLALIGRRPCESDLLICLGSPHLEEHKDSQIGNAK